MPHLKNSKLLGYPVDKVFAVALDLERYPEILPYVKAVKITSRNKARIATDLTLGFSFVSFVHRCVIDYRKNKSLYVQASSSVFETFHSRCSFEAAGSGKTRIVYELDAKFKNRILEWLATALLPLHAEMTLAAFTRYLDRL